INFCVGVWSSILAISLLRHFEVTVWKNLVHDVKAHLSITVDMYFEVDAVGEYNLNLVCKRRLAEGIEFLISKNLEMRIKSLVLQRYPVVGDHQFLRPLG